jgi:hypothetical protein
MAHDEPVKPPAEPALAKEERSLGFAAPSPEQKARAATAAPMLRSPASPMASVVPAPPPPAPPPPPPPPAPMAEREAADAIAAESGNIVVTGSSISRQNTKSAAPTPPARNEDVYASFQGKLQSAFQSNNRNAILALVGYPLRVEFNGDVRTYRNRSDVERDYARIFTSEVRESVLNGQASRYLTFATSPPGSAIKIREVRP